MESDLNKFILGLSLIPGFGFRRIKKLFDVFEDAEKIWNLNYFELKNVLGENLASIFVKNRDNINTQKELEKYQKLNINIISYFDEIYPELLKEIYSPPIILFAIGNLEILKNKNLLSIVGTRKYSEYGKLVAQNFISKISDSCITIVSGLAIGIDSFAHSEALKGSGSTIAVLGSAIDQIYPRSNFALSQKIQEKGLIISELPIGAKFAKENFPMRNRIIAGLSKATLLIEASRKSGALITTNFAINENREVLVVPGKIFDKNFEGNNFLIKQGAKVFTEINDVLEIYNMQTETEKTLKKDIAFEDSEQKLIYEILNIGPLVLDKIIINSRLNVNIVIASLTKMELLGIVENIGNQTYKIKSN